MKLKTIRSSGSLFVGEPVEAAKGEQAVKLVSASFTVGGEAGRGQFARDATRNIRGTIVRDATRYAVQSFGSIAERPKAAGAED